MDFLFFIFFNELFSLTKWNFLHPTHEVTDCDIVSGDVLEMPVPASYNDITTNSTIRWHNQHRGGWRFTWSWLCCRDYVGWAWYSTQFYVDPRWEGSRVVIRLGSVHYNAIVYINGEFVTEHSGGHLPFEADVSDVLKYSAKVVIQLLRTNSIP